MLDTYGRLWELMESGQNTRFGEIMTDDCYFYSDDQTYEGLVAVQEYFRDVMVRLPDLHHEVTSIIVGDDGLAAEVVAKGTMQHGPQGHPVKVEIKACDFLWFEEGRISRWHAYTDSAGLQRQLGAS
jgi:predicted ester cyclase